MSDELSKGISVLIVDDNEKNLQIAAKVVSKAGYRVMLAPDGMSALELIIEQPPDVILLDIMMPGIDGLEVCRRIKEISGCDDIPIIFLSAMGEENSIEEGLSLGGADYVTKPFSERVLLARLRSHIERAQYQKKLAHYSRELEEKNQNLVLLKEKILAVNQDLEKQIEKNIQIFATLNDKIRNPLCVVVTMLEMQDNENSGSIIEQLNRIDKVVDDLDKGFIESEKVKAYLKKHHDLL
jgi:DNA-binding response OmpR family regulator